MRPACLRQHASRIVLLPTPATVLPSSRPVTRGFASTFTNLAGGDDAKPVTASLNPRWLADLRQRVGKCIQWGLQGTQAGEAGSICREIAQDWRELVAGSEGFLTGEDRRGLYRHAVAWGDM
ncbi:hypothetical protein LTS18_001673, partial [Coniosporium uncinatum]